MRYLLVTIAMSTLVAGMAGCCGEDHVPPAPTPAVVPACPPLRSVTEERQLIDLKGEWEARKAMLDVKPVTLVVGSETLVYAPKISWKPGKKFDIDFQFFRLVGGDLEQVNVKLLGSDK